MLERGEGIKGGCFCYMTLEESLVELSFPGAGEGAGGGGGGVKMFLENRIISEKMQTEPYTVYCIQILE